MIWIAWTSRTQSGSSGIQFQSRILKEKSELIHLEAGLWWLGTWNPRTLVQFTAALASYVICWRPVWDFVSNKENKQTNKGYSNESITKDDEEHIQRNQFNKQWGEEGSTVHLQIKEW